MTGPGWVEHVVWWQLHPLGFVGAEPRARGDGGIVHRLGHIRDWLDYAVALGASGIALGPVFASSSHGYDTVDYFRIDPRLGDESDFDALIAAARQRGLRVLLDGVFNHVGHAFPAFRQVLEHGPQAPEARWFKLSWSGEGSEPDHACFEGHHHLVTLDHDEPAVADHVVRVMTHWLARGADGWRLDAAYAVPGRFWAGVLARVRAAHPGAYFVGEVIHGDYAAIVAGTGMDSVTQYELWKAIWSGLNDRNFFELAWALDRHNGFLDSFVPLTFVGNHDVTRLASQLADIRHLPHALAVLFTIGGTPSVYAGDEQAFQGVKEHRAGGDDAVRPVFPALPDALAPFGWPVYRLHQDLIGLRRRHPWLHTARTKAIHLSNRQLVFEAGHGEGRLLVALNVGEAGSVLPVPHAGRVALGLGSLEQPGSPEARIFLPAHGWAILEPRLLPSPAIGEYP